MTTPNFPVQGRWIYQYDPHLFDTLRKQSIAHLQTTFGRVLGRADDWLFDLAQKEGAVSGSPQIEAMRNLRMARAPMERGFLAHFEAGFDALHRKIVPAEQSSRVLSLVEEDQLEAQLASEVVIEAILRAHGPALDAIDSRFAVMIGANKLDPSLNPLSAVSLANGVQAAQSEVSLPENLRVVLFKLYERELVQSLGTLLTELNARMSAAGILPELGNPRPVDAAPAPTAQAQAHAAQQHSPQNDDRAMFDALCGLLHSWRPHVGDVSGAGVPAGMGAADAGNRRPLAMPELVSVLSLMQNQVPKSVEQAMASPEASLSLLMKQEMMRSAGSIGLPSDAIKMSPDDEDAVDLVGMLFDVLFDERDFEAQARTLISRLVVPFVKAAVIDRRLFQYKTHPARRLLNSLAEAVEGNKGEGPQERELLGKAEETVDKLVAEFNEDIAIFETLEQELRAFLEQHRRRIELAARRATEAQRGQERLEQARTLAASELSRRTANRSVPTELYDFLTRCWSHHLSMIALREGPDSASWNSALGVADSLLELVPQAGHPIRQPGPALNNLRELIEGVLASSGITGEAAHDMIRGMHAGLDAAAAALATPMLPVAAAAAPAASAPAPAAPAEAQPGLVMVADKDRYDYNAEDIPVLRALKIGAWVDLAGEDQKLHPAKLSWVSPISSRLMFVNRRGVRVLVASAEELASMKKLGKLVLREQEQVFDQAMHRVMGRLQSDVA